MNKNKILLSSVVIALLSLPSFAETAKEAPEEVMEDESSIEVSGYLKTEIGAFTGDGASINSNKTHKAGDLLKTEGTLKLFINGDVGEESSFHIETQGIFNGEGTDGYEYHRNYTQYDYLREAYIDTTLSDFDIRIGKQQVVWGKADGVKFLDIINPTDFREWAQNTMEDSRIPLWMGVIEKDLGNNDSLQFVWVPDVGRINQIPGLYNTTTGDQNQPFVSYGADALTGQYNGFLNIGKDMGKVANAFVGAAAGGAFAPATDLSQITNYTVSAFTNTPRSQLPPAFQNTPNGDPIPNGAAALDGNIQGVGATTNLSAGNATYDYNNPTHMFEYMGDTSFATFADFANMETQYRINPFSQKLKNHNFGFKYAKATDFGLNYTLNYYKHWENNPIVNMQWEDSNGQALTANDNNFALDQAGNQVRTVTLQYANGNQFTPSATNVANLVMLQDVNRVDTFGASFDYAVDTSFAPVVIRGEFVYDKGSKAPEVDLGKLAYGDIVNALTMADANIVKYVIGADVTLGKNLFTSLQFMDTWNLDYQDAQVQYAGNTRSYGRYTANPATLGLSNQFRKAEEHQIMYTLFLSKPFLEGDALRVNNLFLLENDQGGYWNRFDLEYSYSDDTILSAEWNKYGGDRFGVFGQFEDMSNVQIGAKYIF